MTRGMWISLASIVAILVLGTTYLTREVAGIEVFTGHTGVTMTLARTAGVAVGSPVLLRGIEVGRVDSMSYGPGGVDLGLEIGEEHSIPVHTAVRIENLSALGEPYIDFRPDTGAGPYLRDGQHIDAEVVELPVALPEMSRSVVDLLHQLDPVVLASLTNTLDRSLAGTDRVVPELSRSTELLAATLLSRLPAMRQLLTDLQDVGSDMAWVEPSARASAPLWTLFAQRFSEIVDSLAGISNVGDTPAMYLEGDGLVPVLSGVTEWLEREGPGLAELAPVLRPLAAPAGPSMDISALITQALGSVGADGSVHLQITVR
ncbi:MlaD family protein [Nocardia flavorosea]|uniref:MCE family protein n=1 Tax=Nocardia flavorosea TaxID=53429 RepID=A0A846YU09_9NOCA|nr:MlaD family protein [Nocardia flavorosea]NKY61030.1 MCE family protein [Nocardia flavorosea]